MASIGTYFAHGQHRDLLVGLLLPACAGIAIGLVTTRYAERLHRRRFSRLWFGDVELIPQRDMLGNDSLFWRIPVSNRSMHPSRDVVAECIELWDDDVRREGTLIAPFNWAHNPPHIYQRDIFRDQVAYLDVVQWNFGLARPIVALPPVMGFPAFSHMQARSTTVVILVSQSSGQRFLLRVQAVFEDLSKQEGTVRLLSIEKSIGASRFWWRRRPGPADLALSLGLPRARS